MSRELNAQDKLKIAEDLMTEKQLDEYRDLVAKEEGYCSRCGFDNGNCVCKGGK